MALNDKERKVVQDQVRKATEKLTATWLYIGATAAALATVSLMFIAQVPGAGVLTACFATVAVASGYEVIYANMDADPKWRFLLYINVLSMRILCGYSLWRVAKWLM